MNAPVAEAPRIAKRRTDHTQIIWRPGLSYWEHLRTALLHRQLYGDILAATLEKDVDRVLRGEAPGAER